VECFSMYIIPRACCLCEHCGLRAIPVSAPRAANAPQTTKPRKGAKTRPAAVDRAGSGDRQTAIRVLTETRELDEGAAAAGGARRAHRVARRRCDLCEASEAPAYAGVAAGAARAWASRDAFSALRHCTAQAGRAAALPLSALAARKVLERLEQLRAQALEGARPTCTSLSAAWPAHVRTAPRRHRGQPAGGAGPGLPTSELDRA
jgi:hypothetical protein